MRHEGWGWGVEGGRVTKMKPTLSRGMTLLGEEVRKKWDARREDGDNICAAEERTRMGKIT